MKSWMTSILLVVMTFAFTPAVDGNSLDANSLINNSIKSAPLLQAEAATNTELKHGSKYSYIALDFVPIVILAETNPHLVRHSYYLPIYHLIRQKEFFLLI